MPAPGSEMDAFAALQETDLSTVLRAPEKEMKAVEEKVERKRLIEAPSLKEQLDAIAKAERSLKARAA